MWARSSRWHGRAILPPFPPEPRLRSFLTPNTVATETTRSWWVTLDRSLPAAPGRRPRPLRSGGTATSKQAPRRSRLLLSPAPRPGRSSPAAPGQTGSLGTAMAPDQLGPPPALLWARPLAPPRRLDGVHLAALPAPGPRATVLQAGHRPPAPSLGIAHTRTRPPEAEPVLLETRVHLTPSGTGRGRACSGTSRERGRRPYFCSCLKTEKPKILVFHGSQIRAGRPSRQPRPSLLLVRVRMHAVGRWGVRTEHLCRGRRSRAVGRWRR